MARTDKYIHSAIWLPTAWWAYRCDPHPFCKDCRIVPEHNSYQMEKAPHYDISKVNCKKCLRKLKALKESQDAKPE